MKHRVFAIFASLLIATGASQPTFALSGAQKDAISGGCASIRQSLHTLQRSDSRTRVYLGSLYQIILSNYMTQLNLRLVKVNQPDAALASSQSDFTDARDDASKKFITYSQSLEELLLIDCANDPEQFYDKLAETRQKRTELSAATNRVRKILDSHLETVTKLKEGLE